MTLVTFAVVPCTGPRRTVTAVKVPKRDHCS